MGKPAARLTDMHTCPMVTPGTPPIPHVGGPIVSPGVPTVLIGFLPAAVVGDQCVCIGPPDAIAMGSPTVFIGNKMAARMGDPTVHGGVIVVGCPTVLIGESGSGGAGGGGGGGGGGLMSPASSLEEGLMCMMPEAPLAPPTQQSAQLACPMNKPDMNSLPDGWQQYHGKSAVFHCGYEGILETRTPSPEALQNECFYDEKGTLVDENHPYAGCGGSPNYYDSEAAPVKHTTADVLTQDGWDGLVTSVDKGSLQKWAWDGTKSVASDVWEGTKQTSDDVINWMGGLFD